MILIAALNQQHGTKFYIDVGAHHPNRFSVTRRLYEMGWSGINIEANNDVKNVFEHWRPRDVFINAAVGTEMEYTFHIFEEPAISTTNNDWKKKFLSEGNLIKEEIRVQGITLNQVIKELPLGQKVELLNIDIEGSDYDALISISFETLETEKFPKWLLLETTMPVDSSLSMPAVVYAKKHGYIPWCVLPMGTLLKYQG